MPIRGFISDLDLDERLFISIVGIAEKFKKHATAIFKNYGITFPQYSVLRILENSDNGQNTISNVGRIQVVSGANMTGLAKRLEKNGFLIRKGDPKDERITLLEITPKGRRTLHNISKEKDEVVFLHKIVEGGTDKSYGIHVAKLAGVPPEVINRAKVIMKRIENQEQLTKTLVPDEEEHEVKREIHITETITKKKKKPKQLDLFEVMKDSKD